ncbi:hypothetical protein NST17_19135 [Caldifermentibacillus hisashii]|uniref:Uncharacterized protein n=1 Tax=Caldifermentibacillus hisashii TaxID=996558 RepID=A0ABU9K2B2_9BACI
METGRKSERNSDLSQLLQEYPEIKVNVAATDFERKVQQKRKINE